MKQEHIKQVRSIIDELQMSAGQYVMYLIPRELKLESQDDFDDTYTFKYKNTTFFRFEILATTPKGIYVGYEFSFFDHKFLEWGYVDDFQLVLCRLEPCEEWMDKKLFMSIDLSTMEQTKLELKIIS
jgi:hypothetical protein